MGGSDRHCRGARNLLWRSQGRHAPDSPEFAVTVYEKAPVRCYMARKKIESNASEALSKIIRFLFCTDSLCYFFEKVNYFFEKQQIIFDIRVFIEIIYIS